MSDENERYGHHAVRAIAKGARVRNSTRASNAEGNQAGTFCALLALAAASRRVPGAGYRKADTRDPTGRNPSKAGRAEQDESADLPVPQVRRSQNLWCTSVPPMLAYFREQEARPRRRLILTSHPRNRHFLIDNRANLRKTIFGFR